MFGKKKVKEMASVEHGKKKTVYSGPLVVVMEGHMSNREIIGMFLFLFNIYLS